MSLYSGMAASARARRCAGRASVWGCRVVTLGYKVHGKILTGVSYDNRFVSIAFIENRKIVRWRDYMDFLAAWTAFTSSAGFPTDGAPLKG